MQEHPHISLFGSVECNCTEKEAANLSLVAAFRAAKVSERKPFLASDFRRHRTAFPNIGELWEYTGSMEDSSMPDRENFILELTAKDDKVWGIFRMVGTHTGVVFGIPATDRHIDVLEVALFRIEDGAIAEAWFFGEELGLLRDMGVNPPDLSSSPMR